MPENNTALARREGSSEIEAIRQQGSAMVEKQKELNTVARMLEGVQWGNVKGSSLSAQTRYAVARICQDYNADPLLHIHILGGNVYLNAQYWAEQVNDLPNLKGWHQNNISAGYVEEIRRQAKQVFEDAKEFESDELKQEALDLLAKARFADERRAFFGVPDTAVAAYETVIEFTDREPVMEANYAPTKNDPVGTARPAETARSRSMRRAGAKASPRIKTLDELAARSEIKAEWQVIRSDEEEALAALPGEDGPQALRVGAGEPEAAAPVDAEPLPVQEVGTRVPSLTANARSEKKKFEDGCRAMGVDDVGAFIVDHLGHAPASLEDYQHLNGVLARMADDPEGAEQEGFL